ncbi:DUF983 domain-containing protein [Lichenihabitans psoromatis]|uniref:DUF983 domain-containing protein n=1 Tax=Lichenihabitans psoromatis TaxID=2528642 RepID=UPI00103663A0|nr:DUF983 domain-containing protein [Lichenihabitans psoromatis]
MTILNLRDETRDTMTSLKRGVVGRCPRCGKGHIFRAYLKVQDQCEVCGEDLHHHRADDAPPYITILIVAHIMGFIMLVVLTAYEDIPFWIQMTLWPGLVLALCLTLLPRIKGALIGLQWAQRMHGFGGETDPIG